MKKVSHKEYITAIWYIFPPFWYLKKEKSGNPGQAASSFSFSEKPNWLSRIGAVIGEEVKKNAAHVSFCVFPLCSVS
jgi:hypothetical protein